MHTRTTRSAPFPRRFARFNRKVANPVIRLVAGWLPPFAIVKHRGRVTGRGYATPVPSFGTGDGLVAGVLYGTSSDWVSNALAAGQVEVKRLGTAREYEQLRLVGRDEGLPLLPAIVRGAFRLLGVRAFLRLTALPTASGIRI